MGSRKSWLPTLATLFRRSQRSTFYYRVTIPRELRPYFRMVQIWRSLRTNDIDHATLRSAQLSVQFQKLVITLKKDAPNMTPTEIDTLVTRWMDTELQRTEDIRAQHHFDEDQRGVMVDLAADKYEESALFPAHAGRVVIEADALLKDAGLPAVDHDSMDFKRLCRRLSIAQREVLGIELERWQNVYQSNHRPTGAAAGAGTVAPPTYPLFSEVVAQYFKENTRAERTDSQIKAEFNKFITVLGGDRPIASITKEQGRAYKEHVLKDRSPATWNKHHSSLSGLFKWSALQGLAPDNFNPMQGLGINKRQAKKHAKPRRPFTDAELLTVLSSPEFIAQREKNPTRYWVILLCVFQICRREEPSQLLVKDIGEADGIPFMRVTNEGEQQNLKTGEKSKRRLPIHSSLIALGFLEYVESMRSKGHSRLFPDLEKGANGFGDAVGKYFSRLVTSVGLTDPGLVLHSTRHGGITKLHGAGVQTNLVEMLAGHTSQTVNGSIYTHWESIGFCPTFTDTWLRLIMSQEGCHGTEAKVFSGVQT